MTREPVLCYVAPGGLRWAWFTTAPLSMQWGEDWHGSYDASGRPRRTEGFSLVYVIFNAALHDPHEQGFGREYTPKEINAGAIPWLVSPDYEPHEITLYAGAPLDDFKQAIAAAGGAVFVEETITPRPGPFRQRGPCAVYEAEEHRAASTALIPRGLFDIPHPDDVDGDRLKLAERGDALPFAPIEIDGAVRENPLATFTLRKERMRTCANPDGRLVWVIRDEAARRMIEGYRARALA